jgi:hypothetical protein
VAAVEDSAEAGAAPHPQLMALAAEAAAMPVEL